MKKKRYKARLVAKGYQQKEGIDYHETYAPVARLPTIRFLLALVVNKSLHTRHLDVTTAFLYGELREDVYLKIPHGVEAPPNKVLKLRKSLYGLKQSPKCWYNKFHSFITSVGFKQSKADYCLYFSNLNGIVVYLVLYVDDMLVASNCNRKIDELIEQMATNFK